jgi:hypothetical protein
MKRRISSSIDRALRATTKSRKPPRRPPGKSGGSEAVAVEPNRPKLGEGGAAAALEFDDRA